MAFLAGALFGAAVGRATAPKAKEGPTERTGDTAPAPAAPANRSWSRDEFRQAVKGKSKEELIALLGRPDSTLELSTGHTSTWTYKRPTNWQVVEPVTGKADETISVHVKMMGGKWVGDSVLFLGR